MIKTNTEIEKDMTDLLVMFFGENPEEKFCHTEICNGKLFEKRPGDEIIGYISQGKGVTIHKKDCPNLKYLDPERLIDVDWEGDAKTEFYAEIKLVAEKSPNILNKITSNLSTSKVVLRKFEANESGEFLECAIVILAKSRDDVKDTCNLLSQISGVRKVSRIS